MNAPPCTHKRPKRLPPAAVAGTSGQTARANAGGTPGLVRRADVLLETASELRASEDRKSLSLTGDFVSSPWRAPVRGLRSCAWAFGRGEQEEAVATTHLGRLRRRRLGVAFRIRDFFRPRTIIDSSPTPRCARATAQGRSPLPLRGAVETENASARLRSSSSQYRRRSPARVTVLTISRRSSKVVLRAPALCRRATRQRSPGALCGRRRSSTARRLQLEAASRRPA